jgi:hypothetical protein
MSEKLLTESPMQKVSIEDFDIFMKKNLQEYIAWRINNIDDATADEPKKYSLDFWLEELLLFMNMEGAILYPPPFA